MAVRTVGEGRHATRTGLAAPTTTVAVRSASRAIRCESGADQHRSPRPSDRRLSPPADARPPRASQAPLARRAQDVETVGPPSSALRLGRAPLGKIGSFCRHAERWPQNVGLAATDGEGLMQVASATFRRRLEVSWAQHTAAGSRPLHAARPCRRRRHGHADRARPAGQVDHGSPGPASATARTSGMVQRRHEHPGLTATRSPRSLPGRRRARHPSSAAHHATFRQARGINQHRARPQTATLCVPQLWKRQSGTKAGRASVDLTWPSGVGAAGSPFHVHGGIGVDTVGPPGGGRE
jgi:hypothetical protein